MIRQHVSNVHKTNERVSCDICGSSLKNISSLKSHLTKCRKKHGIPLSSHNHPLSLLKPVKSVIQEEVRSDDSGISDNTPVSMLKTTKKEKAIGDSNDSDEGVQRDNDPFLLINNIKKQTVSGCDEDDNTAPPVDGEYKMKDDNQDASVNAPSGFCCNDEDVFGLD